MLNVPAEVKSGCHGMCRFNPATKQLTFLRGPDKSLKIGDQTGDPLCSAGGQLESMSPSDGGRTDFFLESIAGEVSHEEIQKELRA